MFLNALDTMCILTISCQLTERLVSYGLGKAWERTQSFLYPDWLAFHCCLCLPGWFSSKWTIPYIFRDGIFGFILTDHHLYVHVRMQVVDRDAGNERRSLTVISLICLLRKRDMPVMHFNHALKHMHVLANI